MSLRRRWNPKLIETQLARVAIHGETVVGFPTITEAESFRSACYKHAKKHYTRNFTIMIRAANVAPGAEYTVTIIKSPMSIEKVMVL